MKRLIFSIGTVLFAGGAIAVGATGAFFSDTENSVGNTFASGAIDLKVDNESFYNGLLSATTTWEATDLTIEKFFDFNDLKPDDYGEDTISLHVDTNDAYLCANVTLTSNNDNGCTEPEGLLDQTCDNPGEGQGELASNVNFLWWADDGDNVLENDETVITQGAIGSLPLNQAYPIALADSDENIWTGVGGPVVGGGDYYIGKAWCFGTLTPAPLTPGEYPDGPAGDNDGNQTAGQPEDGGILCDGTTLGNETQTDSLTADVSFEAVQARNNPNFQCDEPELVRECTNVEVYADAFYDVNQGTRKNGTPVLAARSNANAALGAPQSLGTPYDNPPPADNNFFSLGFKSLPVGTTATTTPGGSVVLSFPGNVVDGSGADLKLWEVTGGTNYPDELVKVEVSNSLAGPWTVVAASVTRDAEIDIAPVTSAKYVRITDISPPGPFEATADGFDLDAVQALNCVYPL